MEDHSLRNESMPNVAEVRQPPREVPDSTHSVKGFGLFLVKANDHLTLKTLKKLTTAARFGLGVWDRIERAEWPGLSFLEELESRGEITEDNISFLKNALDSIGSHGISTVIERLYNEHCCIDPDKNTVEVSETSTRHGLVAFPNQGPNFPVHPKAIYEVTSMETVLNMTPGEVVPSVRGVLVKIGLHRVSFRKAGSILRLQNATRNFLTAIVDEEIQSTLCFREGDVIEVNNFKTKRSQNGNSNTCFLLSEQGSTIQKVTDEQLLYVARQLPVFECKQIRGVCTYLQVKPYEACEKENCREKKLKNTDSDPNKLFCPRCGTEYFRSFQKLGWYIEVNIGEDSTEDSENSRRLIIFKNTVMDIFPKMKVLINRDKHEAQKKFEELFNEKEVRAIVRPGHPRGVIIDLMLVPRSQGPK